MQIARTTTDVIARGIGFVARQKRDWKLTAARNSLDRFYYQMVFPFQSIYTIGLGASATQLGIVNSVGMGVGSLLAPFTGWLIDRMSVKKIYLAGVSLFALSYLIYSVAQSWTVIIIAMIVYWLGYNVAWPCCTVICANCLADRDRATAMSLCETFAWGAMGTVSPLLGALLVTSFGGVNVSGIRPLFFITSGGTVVTFLLLLTQLSGQSWGKLGHAGTSFFKDTLQVFKYGRNLKRWVAIYSVTYLPYGMLLPFIYVFAHEVKGAEQYVLGAMVTGMALTSLLAGVPLGRLADRIGRKKVLLLLAPVFYAANLLLVWAPSHAFLIAAGVLEGAFIVSLSTAGAMTAELVPADQMGRWQGVQFLFIGLVTAIGAFLAGVIWDSIGPAYLFLSVIALDVLIRIPLLLGMPETLGLRLVAE
ncbi:MAG: MFS transporter [Chloroflexi bacterium]|nr:MFS transporter [Chloroflexota bacterium]